MLHVLWPLAGGVIAWFAAKLLCGPLIDIMILRRQIHQEFLVLSKEKLLSEDWCLHLDQQRAQDGAWGRNIGEFGTRLTALNASLRQPLPFILERLGYDLDRAAANLRRLSSEWDDSERPVMRHQIEIALRLRPCREVHDCKANAIQAKSKLYAHHDEI
jgi:hypothetical protein